MDRRRLCSGSRDRLSCGVVFWF